MGKLLLLLIPLLIMGCEKSFDNTIDTPYENYQVFSVGPTGSVSYNADDSLATISITFTFESEINEVYCDIIASDNSKLNSSPFQLFESNNNRYQNDFPISTYYPNGIYTTNYYVNNTSGNMQFVARGSFTYINGQDNVAPVISNSVIDPDTAVVNDTTVIFTSLVVTDSNGANDIAEAFFIVYKPNGSTNNIKIFLYDDGNTEEHGDLTVGDNIYSRLIQVDQSNDKGTYRFEFRAKDRLGAYSNTINHFVLIQ